MSRILPALLLPCLLASAPALALRCPNGVVDIGDHEIEVLDACGEPLTRDQVIENPSRVLEIGGERVRQVLGVDLVYEEWIYEFSPQRFRSLLRFRNHRLVEVRDLDKPD